MVAVAPNNWTFYQDVIADVISVLFLSGIGYTLLRAHRDKSVSLDLADCLRDDTGSWGSKARLNMSWLIFTWAIVFEVLTNNFSEWLATVYIGAFVVDRSVTKITDTIVAVKTPEIKGVKLDDTNSI